MLGTQVYKTQVTCNVKLVFTEIEFCVNVNVELEFNVTKFCVNINVEHYLTRASINQVMCK